MTTQARTTQARTAQARTARARVRQGRATPRFGSALGLSVAVSLLTACAPSQPAPTQPGPTSSVTPGAPGPDSGSSASPSQPTTTPRPATLELPRGGTTVFPRYRLMGYSGAPNAPGQGRLGIGNLDDRMREMQQRAKPYAQGKTILPVMELIATTVHPVPGKDGKYRTRISDAAIAKWLRTARRHKAILLLNIQPGRASFLAEVQAYERWLAEPDVGLALDPEWAVGPGQVPGRVFGHTTGTELNSVAKWTADLVQRNNLPEKVIVYHQLNPRVVRNEADLKAHNGVVLIKSVDGIGPPGAKVATWNNVVKTLPKHVYPGFKLFYEEDTANSWRLMTPAEVLALKPTPVYVLYE